ncbi:MAG TPA: uroporphyrinogen decarboxylase family protein [Negativicutes bacterium]|nr:uroporphyrinogen decarboxylase family protein [Negativicutes bacterium]
MKPRDIVLQAIRPQKGVQLSRFPVALLSGGTWTFLQRDLSLKNVLDHPAVAPQVIVDVNNEIQSDIVWPGSGYHNLLAQIFGGKIKFRERGNIDVIGTAFDNLAALDKLDVSLIDKNEWIGSLREIIAAVHEKIGEQYLIGTSSWGPFTLAGQFYGVEKVMSGLYKDKAGIHALLEVMTEVAYRYLSPAVAKGAQLISIAEPTASGDLISLRHFEEFVAPYLAQLISRLKQDGALITLHICGNINDRVKLVPGLGVDLLSVDYKVDLTKAAEVLDNKVALAGNVNPVILKDGLTEDLIVATQQSLRKGRKYERFVLMPGCDIPPVTPLANVKTFFSVGLDAPRPRSDY